MDKQKGVDTAPAKGPYFATLDLVRGLAALVVLIYHVDFMFGLRHELLPGGYLAVDLFFVLSGVVLSLNYGERIAGRTITFRSYLVARIARLYPLFLATTVIGFVVMTIRYRANYGYVDSLKLLESGLLNTLMLPSFAEPYGVKPLFIFNPASWTILFEMVASLLFFLYLARAGTRSLVVIAIVAGGALAAVIVSATTVDLGYSTENILAGFPRVMYSFTIGVLIERLFARRPWQCPSWCCYGLLIAVIVLMQLKLLDRENPLFDILAVGVILPLLVAVSVGSTLTGRAYRLARFLGETSYSVYLTQGALIIIAAGLTQSLVGEKIYDLAPWAGFVFVLGVVTLSFLTYRFYEQPARIFFRQFARSRTRETAENARSRI
jgi:peptidoglycan/LPS O-acetylase OafA/YrhL